MKTPQESGHGLHSTALFVGVVFAIAGVLLVVVYMKRFEAESSGGGRVALLAVTRDVPAGKVVTEDVLAVRFVPSAYVDDRMVLAKDRDRVVGIEAVIPLNAQNTLQWSDLAVRTDIRNLSQLVAPGKRAVTVQTRGGDQQNLLVRPGDYVDVLASTNVPDGHDGDRTERATTVLLQRALVLAVGLSTDRKSELEKGGSNAARVLTLSLEIEEAELLTLAMEQGAVSVVVRNPEDQKIQEALPDIQASSLIEARDRVRAHKNQGRPELKGPIKMVEAR